MLTDVIILLLPLVFYHLVHLNTGALILKPYWATTGTHAAGNILGFSLFHIATLPKFLLQQHDQCNWGHDVNKQPQQWNKQRSWTCNCMYTDNCTCIARAELEERKSRTLRSRVERTFVAGRHFLQFPFVFCSTYVCFCLFFLLQMSSLSPYFAHLSQRGLHSYIWSSVK